MKLKAYKLTYPVLVVLILALGLFSSCGKNRLKTNEKSLTKQILTEEEQIAHEATLREQREKQLADSLAKLPKGFRFKEDRSVDPGHQPVVIDIAGTNENIKDFKLSSVASYVKYIRLETPPDSMLLWLHPKLISLKPSIISDDKHIIFQGLFGITRFSMEGKFQEIIWKNTQGINAKNNFVSINPQEFLGVIPNKPVSLFNNNLFLLFQDANKHQIQVIKKEIQDNLVIKYSDHQPENRKDTLQGERLLAINMENRPGDYLAIYGLLQNCWAGISTTWNSIQNKISFVVFNNSGDTLCVVSNPNKIKNWSKSQNRNGEAFTYYYKNQLTYLGLYSDTIFRFIPPNKMLPVYILDFGEDKVRIEDGLDPDSDLSQKIMLYSIFETDKFVFIRYTKNFVSPQNLKNKSVIFYNAIFDKNENKVYHLPGESLEPQDIINDLDGGISFWPEFVTPRGEMGMLVLPERLKTYLGKDENKPATEKAEKLGKFAEILNSDINERIIMFVK